MSRYIVDTFIWIEFLRGRIPALKNRISNLLTEDRIVINGVIESELLMGACGKKEVEFVNEKLTNLDYLEIDRNFLRYCGILGNKIRKEGINMPLSDIMIAAHAKINNLIIFTMDKHFEAIGQKFGIQFEIIENFLP